MLSHNEISVPHTVHYVRSYRRPILSEARTGCNRGCTNARILCIPRQEVPAFGLNRAWGYLPAGSKEGVHTLPSTCCVVPPKKLLAAAVSACPGGVSGDRL